MIKANALTLVALAGMISANATEKIEVWDLGAEQLTTETYTNMLSETEINGWFVGVEAGTANKTIGDITASEGCNFIFNGGGKTNHRLRTTNTNLTRYDAKSIADANGVVYTGYIYSNAGSTPNVYVQQTYTKNDIVEFYVGSNGKAETYVLESPSGIKVEKQYTAAAKCEKLTFYIAEDGSHKLYGLDEKLVIARITRQKAEYATLSGTITAPASIPAGYKLCFTNASNGIECIANITDGSYSLNDVAIGYDYTVSLVDANGYIVSEGKDVTVTSAEQTHNITVVGIDTNTISGKIVGLSAADLAKLAFQITLPSGKVFEPQMTINDDSYSLKVEKGVEYTIEALNVNDFALNIESISASSDETKDLTFAAKPVYDITIVPTVATLGDLTAATFTFTNLYEAGYVYTFTGTSAISLRNGIYSVKVGNSGIYTQLLTSNIRVDGATVSKTIDFTASVNEWVFNDADFTTGGYEDSKSTYTYKMLEFSGAKSHNGTYLFAGNGASIKVPVTGKSMITVNACYEYHLNIDETVIGDAKTSSTSQIDALTYTYNGAAGTVEIQATGTCYINSISVNEIVALAETITVGHDKDYATINEAMAAIRKMSRPNDERVVIMIDAGNYEEMVEVNVANVSFVNASAAPSIAIKNGGVDIDGNAVRITGYYGHGYNYFSMNNSYLWNARTLAVNKENGYTEVENPGGGSTLWNSTVLVSAVGFEAENIIFENSYNQYISKKESEDVVVEIENVGKGTRPTDAGNTDVQARSYRERASAIGFTATGDRAFLNNCRVIGRQDAIYGSEGARIACYRGVLMGACDYIFGGMTLACLETELALNTTEDNNDVAYITASKNSAGNRGYLFYDCHITSAKPEVEMASNFSSKPGYFGRPWSADGEAVFYNTTIDASTFSANNGQSLIVDAGWNNGLVSSGSANSLEYGTIEKSGEDNSASRVSWASVLTSPVLNDNTAINCFNFTKGSDNWDPLTKYATGIFAPADSNDATIYAIGNEVFVNNIDGTAHINVYSIDGRLAQSFVASDEARFTTDNGVRLIKVTDNKGTKTVKILIK